MNPLKRFEECNNGKKFIRQMGDRVGWDEYYEKLITRRTFRSLHQRGDEILLASLDINQRMWWKSVNIMCLITLWAIIKSPQVPRHHVCYWARGSQGWNRTIFLDFFEEFSMAFSRPSLLTARPLTSFAKNGRLPSIHTSWPRPYVLTSCPPPNFFN